MLASVPVIRPMDSTTIQVTTVNLNREKVLISRVAADSFTITDSQGNCLEVIKGNFDLRADMALALIRDSFNVSELKTLHDSIMDQLKKLEDLEHNAGIRGEKD